MGTYDTLEVLSGQKKAARRPQLTFNQNGVVLPHRGGRG